MEEKIKDFEGKEERLSKIEDDLFEAEFTPKEILAILDVCEKEMDRSGKDISDDEVQKIIDAYQGYEEEKGDTIKTIDRSEKTQVASSVHSTPLSAPQPATTELKSGTDAYYDNWNKGCVTHVSLPSKEAIERTIAAIDSDFSAHDDEPEQYYRRSSSTTRSQVRRVSTSWLAGLPQNAVQVKENIWSDGVNYYRWIPEYERYEILDKKGKRVQVSIELDTGKKEESIAL